MSLAKYTRRTVQLAGYLSVSLAGVFLGLLAVVGVPADNVGYSDSAQVIAAIDSYHVATIMDQEFFDDAIERATDFGNRPESRVWILPHHLVPREITAGFLKSQSAVKNPKTIVIIGPDHLSRASASLVTSDLPWKTPYGFVDTDSDYIKEITEGDMVKIDHDVFDEEHSVSALVPFVKAFFPDSKIVPLLIQEDIDSELRYAIADILADDMVIAIASVDFSHYLPSDVAELHDKKSRRIIQNRSYKDLSDLEIDSAATLAFAFDFAEQTASEEFDFYTREDSDAFFGYPVYETTSYIIGGFTYVAQNYDSEITFMAVGDMMFGREESGVLTDPFVDIAGAEDRFFQGVDVIVGNLEGAFSQLRDPKKENDFAFQNKYAELLKKYNFDAVSLANNHSWDQGEAGYIDTTEVLSELNIGYFGHQENELANVYTKEVGEDKVSVIGVNLIEQNVDKDLIKQVVKTAESNSDYQIVMIHWGEQFESKVTDEQVEWGRLLVDWGADAVIGTHPHVMQGMEIYKNSPILWSLGNFIFDQDFSYEVKQGIATGITFSSATTTVQIFPVEIEDSRPKLATSSKESVLEQFVNLSELDNEKIEHSDFLLKINIIQ